MNTYIAFLVVIFVLARVAPKLIRHPAMLLSLCILLCLSIYSTQLVG